MLGVLSRADGLNDEGDKHTNAGGKKQGPSANFVDKEAYTDSGDELDDGEVTVDLELGFGVLDTNRLEHTSEVVRNEAVARQLGEETEADENDETVAVARRGP